MSNRLDPYYDFRQEMVNELTERLVGPSSASEAESIINEPPLSRFVTGILYPRAAGSLAAELDGDLHEDDTESGGDPPIALANVRYPSTIGLTFTVDTSIEPTISIAITGAYYEPIESTPQENGAHASLPLEWKRISAQFTPIIFELSRSTGDSKRSLDGNLDCFVRTRATAEAARISVTVALINTAESGPNQFRDSTSFFQPQIRITGASGGECFCPRQNVNTTTDDDELLVNELLYRHARSFGVGHGCAVSWDQSSESGLASEVRTEIIPTYSMQLTHSNPNIESPALEFGVLAEHKRDWVIDALTAFLTGYEQWILDQSAAIPNLDDRFRSAAQANMSRCSEAHERIRAGIEILASDETAWEAFRLTNQAMLEQRARADWIKRGRNTSDPDYEGEYAWYPFQLGFVLMCLPGIVDSQSADRQLADLLWFPTGGGKTEAYLGLIAFTILLRRLRGGDASSGVTVIMRYTLRLLTIQQFERAAMMITCLEHLRRGRSELGSTPIEVGLWVGRGSTPNTRKATRKSLDKLHSGRDIDEQNPMQIAQCPWCGDILDHDNYWLDGANTRLVIGCKNHSSCDFADKLPILVVDEDIYDFRPSLIVATVDKFACLPWSDRAPALFNIGTDAAPPELIVQDELHLISGPLGTLTGLYETAIDRLCTNEGVSPKIIASTATIRRAGAQVRGIFNRDVRQFPPPALDARDSYFAVEATSHEKGNRQYVGVFAPGTSHTTLLVRAYAALLQGCTSIDTSMEHARDPYWTLIGYFNSLRVLGGARMQVQDDVQEQIALLAHDHATRRELKEPLELTSRRSSSEIPLALKQLAVEFPDPNALDVVLATNMISVGIDIDRLGLMVMMGQPQATAEYIQATSRVGRRFPGLVITLYNSARSRDRSHYESFTTYHSAIYRQVESTSVTPFSPRARDRGLHAVVVALARALEPSLLANDKAREVDTIRSVMPEIRRIIGSRVKAIDPGQYNATMKQVDEIEAAWVQRATLVPSLEYRNDRTPESALLVETGKALLHEEDFFPTLWSLRDVDQVSTLHEIRERR